MDKNDYCGSVNGITYHSYKPLTKPKKQRKSKRALFAVGALTLSALVALGSVNNKNIIEKHSTELNQENINTKLDELVNEKISTFEHSIISKTYLSYSFSELSKYDDYISEASESTGLSKNFLYAIFSAESKGKLRAESKVGAKGPAQFMPGTAKEMGLKMNKYIDERCHPKSFVKAAEYLTKHLKKSNKDYVILAGYNWGPTVVNKIIKEHGDSWEVFSQHLPQETKEYIIKIKANESMLDNKLNFKKKKLFSQEIAEADQYVVQSGDSIYNIAKKKKVSIKEIKNLNPEIINSNRICVGFKLYIPKKG